jgi:HlyD family type I secretion membrane fusion protein
MSEATLAGAAPASQRERALGEMVIGDERGAREIRRWRRIGLVVLAATFGTAVLWSALAPLSSAVVAAAAIKVDSSRKKIQHPEGGVIKEIVVQDGRIVRAGDVLVRLDEARAGAAHSVVVGGRDLALATQARLHAERDDRPSVTFPKELEERAAGNPQVVQTMRAQEALFLARRSARSGELGILDQQIAALRNEIEGFRSQLQSKREQLESLESDLESLRALDSQGMVEKTKLRALERDVARARGESEELGSRIASTRTVISEKELKKFQVRKAFQEDVAAELKKVQAEGFELLERESAARRTLELTELRAPVDGTVTDLKVHTAGGVVGPGEVLMEIVPSSDRLIIEARVAPQDVDRVRVGLPAGVKLHAFNARTTPELQAAVTYVSADAAVDQRTDTSWFMVRLDFSPESLRQLGTERRVMPGMQADVFIRTGERTFLGYLMQPLIDSFDKAWRER